jgi:ethanolamine ammonia-lyase small subunit
VTAPDPWQPLRHATPARIGLRRTGSALQAGDVLSFQLACADARDAVDAALDVGAISDALASFEPMLLHSAARDREEYLRRPDLGRRLEADVKASLPRSDPDILFVLADGLSARAALLHGPALIAACIDRLRGWSARIAIVEQGRVAIGDDIGEALGAAACVMLLGERPGLSVPDSLGAYITFAPKIGRRDSERNCVSNIHSRGGLSIARAADSICWLLREARKLGQTGVALKDRSATPPTLTHSEPR